MAVTPQQIADRLGRDLTPAEVRQVPIWIADAVALIDARADRLGVTIDPAVKDRIVALAVVAMSHNPTGETQTRVTIDDGTVDRRRISGTGQVSILDEWWDELGLTEAVGVEWSGSVPYGWC